MNTDYDGRPTVCPYFPVKRNQKTTKPLPVFVNSE